jgi:hypothetical protein
MPADQGLLDRLQRADSWIQAASALPPDRLHEAFIFLYIAFNCLYGRRKYEGDASQIEEDLDAFFTKVLAMHERDAAEGERILTGALKVCREDGAVLIRDRFLVNRYWRGNQPPATLQPKLNKEAVGALEALADGDYREYLGLVFHRISVLRNQVMHGCATYGARSYGRASLAKALRVLRVLIPAFYQLARRYGHDLSWDPIPYPRLGSMQHPRG